ncbi:MAG: phosphatidylserine decarboxylase [Desulfuromonadales bacterium]|nr:phosphatidylserine decarboxylase [Desulfuromonadales bacterium]
MRKYLLLPMLSCFFTLTICACAYADAKEELHENVIAQLVSLFENETELRAKFVYGFIKQPESSPWYGRGIEDFYSFFANWLKFNPRIETAKKYIDEFKMFYTLPEHRGSIPEAREAVIDEKFAEWLKLFVVARGEYLKSSESKSIVKEWAEENAVAIGQCEIPKGGFSSFNDFFTRRLAPGVRPIYAKDDRSSLVSPADCNVWRDSKWLESDSDIRVKGDSYDLVALLGDEQVSKKYRNGSALTCMLMPDNYHRFHAPVSGLVTYRKDMDGLYFGSKGFFDYFYERTRSVVELKMDNGKHVAIASIGIATISSVSIFKDVGDTVGKGEELGMFEYGGSAMVLLFEPNSLQSVVFDDIPSEYEVRGTNFMMGQLLGKLNK